MDAAVLFILKRQGMPDTEGEEFENEAALALLRVVMCPTGKSGRQLCNWLSSLADKNIPLVPSGKSVLELAPSRPIQRGVSRSSRTLERDAMDAAARLTKRAYADGEVVWS
jgi:hypothetical protein